MAAPVRNNHKEYVMLAIYIEEVLDRIYSGSKRPEYTPVPQESRVHKEINAENMGLDNGVVVVSAVNSAVGFENYEDALAASGLSEEQVIEMITNAAPQQIKGEG